MQPHLAARAALRRLLALTPAQAVRIVLQRCTVPWVREALDAHPPDAPTGIYWLTHRGQLWPALLLEAPHPTDPAKQAAALLYPAPPDGELVVQGRPSTRLDRSKLVPTASPAPIAA